MAFNFEKMIKQFNCAIFRINKMGVPVSLTQDPYNDIIRFSSKNELIANPVRLSPFSILLTNSPFSMDNYDRWNILSTMFCGHGQKCLYLGNGCNQLAYFYNGLRGKTGSGYGVEPDICTAIGNNYYYLVNGYPDVANKKYYNIMKEFIDTNKIRFA